MNKDLKCIKSCLKKDIIKSKRIIKPRRSISFKNSTRNDEFYHNL